MMSGELTILLYRKDTQHMLDAFLNWLVKELEDGDGKDIFWVRLSSHTPTTSLSIKRNTSGIGPPPRSPSSQ